MNAVGEWEANSRHMAQHLRIRTCILSYTRTLIRIRTLVNNTGEIHGDGKLETANVRPQNRLVSTHFESFWPNFLTYPSKKVILCWWYMHHIKSEILTFHLSPTLPELRWRVWRCMAKLSHVQWFFSLPSVAWDDFARTQPAHSMRETVWDMYLSMWKAANCDRFLNFVSGLRSGEDYPTLPMKRSVHWYHPDMRGFGHKYPILASCYFNKVLLK